MLSGDAGLRQQASFPVSHPVTWVDDRDSTVSCVAGVSWVLCFVFSCSILSMTRPSLYPASGEKKRKAIIQVRCVYACAFWFQFPLEVRNLTSWGTFSLYEIICEKWPKCKSSFTEVYYSGKTFPRYFRPISSPALYARKMGRGKVSVYLYRKEALRVWILGCEYYEPVR